MPTHKFKNEKKIKQKLNTGSTFLKVTTSMLNTTQEDGRGRKKENTIILWRRRMFRAGMKSYRNKNGYINGNTWYALSTQKEERLYQFF